MNRTSNDRPDHALRNLFGRSIRKFTHYFNGYYIADDTNIVEALGLIVKRELDEQGTVELQLTPAGEAARDAYFAKDDARHARGVRWAGPSVADFLELPARERPRNSRTRRFSRRVGTIRSAPRRSEPYIW